MSDVDRLVAGLAASVDALAGDRQMSEDIGRALLVEIRRRVPRRSGTLDRSLTVEATPTGGRVVAATAYARVIHDGWPRRHIHPTPFITDGTAAAMPAVATVAVDHAGDSLRKVTQ